MAYTEYIPNAGACLATTNVLSGRGRVRWMVREDSQDPADNGWRIMSHIDTDDYLHSDGCWQIVDYNEICGIEPALIDMWSLPVGSDLQLVDDENGIRILDTASGRQILPPPTPPGGVARAPGPSPHDIAKREDAIAAETCTALSGIPDWDLALVTATVSDTAPTTSRAQLFATGDAADLDLEPWFATQAPPPLRFVAESALPPTLVDDLGAHRRAMPDPSGRQWTTMQYAVQREGQFYYFTCRYR